MRPCPKVVQRKLWASENAILWGLGSGHPGELLPGKSMVFREAVFLLLKWLSEDVWN
jgi:hypothetical protein